MTLEAIRGMYDFSGRTVVTVTPATGISESDCHAVNLGYRDFRSIDKTAWQGCEDQGRLLVPKAGETLFRLKNDQLRS